ncbi:MAG TPA: prolyl oligopeptidase family serine peptidase [Sphingobacteriaceae bacterium]
MRKTFTLLFLATVNIAAVAQKPSKKPLDHSVYDGWQSVSSQKISNDGQWVLYSVTPQQGDASLRITNLKTKAVTSVPRVTGAEFSFDSKYSVFTIKPFYKETRAAKIKKKKADDMPKDSLGIVTLNNSSLFKVGRVKSYKLPEKASGVVAYLLDKAPDSTKKKGITTTKDNDNDFFADDEGSSSSSKNEGTNLVLRRLVTGTEKTFKYVTDYSLSNNGKLLVFVSSGTKKDSVNKPGVFLYDIEKDIVKRISSGKGNYKSLTFDEASAQLAFAAEKGPEKALQKFYSLYYYTIGQDSAKVLADTSTTGIPEKWNVSGDGRIFFSKNGRKLFFGTAPIPAAKDTNLVEFEVAKVDVWNYKDDYLQTMQLRNVDRELKRSYLAVVYPKNAGEVIQLADEQLSDLDLAEDGNGEFALGTTDFGNRIEMQWTGSTFRDLYLVSTIDGSRKKITSKVRGTSSLSPKGNYVAWYDRTDKNWYAYNVKTGKQQQLTKGLDIKFYNELNDVPDDPSPYGVAGWTEGDKEVLIYDRYDIWSFDPEGGAPKNITNGVGRKEQITFRYQDFAAQRSRFGNDEPISIKKPLWLEAFNNVTKENGWYRKNLTNAKDPELVVMAERSFSRPAIAKNDGNFIYTKSSYELSPDLYVSSDFKKETKLSAINPQQENYNWGTAELVKWTTPKGYKSEGILYKPEDFDPAKKYPMVVYFYEKLSDGLYNYIAPAPTPSRLNISYFVSNGYLVFAPDISYEIGYPGKSAEEFINSGVEELKKNAWVDGSKIGIQGQSWGGYQVAHLITRTNMYAAAWAGAPVVNMTSAYGGIRWESGMNRQFQYERTQSRIGATLWEKPELYIENSPLFHFPKVNTPVVVMANDADGAVPWYQGIEMFTALRRLNKPVWMLNYNNEAHNLIHRQNRKDIQIREQQFFDHYLKGKPAPAWMHKGVPATEKGRNWGFEIVEPSTAAQ